MKQSWMPSKFLLPVRALVLLISMFAFAGCFESHHNSGGSGGGSDQKNGNGGGDVSAERPFGLALLDVVAPAPDAFSSPGCGSVPTSLTSLRAGEAAARIKAMQTLLATQADQVMSTTTLITAADCQAFSALENRALTQSMSLPIEADLRAKPALHVRLVIWFGDTSMRAPSSAVVSPFWADFSVLTGEGYTRMLTVNDFAFTQVNTGYIWNWAQASDGSHNFFSDPIDPMPIDGSAAAVIQANVSSSTVNFLNFLTDAAVGL